MIRCKEVSTLISTEQLGFQPVWTRIAVRVHLMMCRHCRRFARQIAHLTRAAANLQATFDREVTTEFVRRLETRLGLN